METVSHSVSLRGPDEARALVGEKDRHLRALRDLLGVRVVLRGQVLSLSGPDQCVRDALSVVDELRATIRAAGHLQEGDVRGALDRVRTTDKEGDLRIPVFVPGRDVRPRSDGQKRYVVAMQQNDLTFATGPAGTGKTYLAVAMAVCALRQQAVRKIVLTRPALEAGERLGFLPGDIQTKINPYLRPLYDALGDMMEPRMMRRYTDEDLLEVAPLAYMRGRTLDHAFIILDEGQNCTRGQMKMFLTRLGMGSKAVVTGDLSQIDLPAHMISGMVEAMEVLKGVRDIAFVQLKQADIVRHRLVQNIVDAYEVHEERLRGAKEGGAAGEAKNGPRR